MDHSCVPNMVCLTRAAQKGENTDPYTEQYMEPGASRFPGRLEMRAIEAIEAGGKLTISYTALFAYTKERRERLAQSYGFLCECPRCSAPEGAKLNPLDLVCPLRRKCIQCTAPYLTIALLERRKAQSA